MAFKVIAALAVSCSLLAPSGHRQTAAENVATTNGVQTIHRLYTYDATYRLANESYSVSGPVALPASASVGYTLDDVGNRLTRASTLPGVEGQSLAYNPNDRLTSDTYDANGNTTVGHLVQSAPTVSDVYDFEDRLINRNNGQVTIKYDGDGNRVRKTVTAPTNTVTTFFVVDELNPTGYAQVLEEHLSLNSQPSTVNTVYTYGHTLISQDRVDGSRMNSRANHRTRGATGKSVGAASRLRTPRQARESSSTSH